MQYLRKFTNYVNIRWRLTILFVVVFGTTLVFFEIFIFNILETTLQREFDDALFNYTVDVNESISLSASGNLSFKPPALDQTKLYPFAWGTALIQIRNTNGVILSRVGDFGSLNVPYHREVDSLKKGEEAVYRTVTKLEGLPNKEAEEYRMLTLYIDSSSAPQLLLQVAVPMTLLEEQIENRKKIFKLSLPLAFLIAVFGGYLLSVRAFRPISEMIATAKAIGAQSLSARLPVPAAKDEVQSLALSLNEMLSRIERAFQSQERFVADASHQLLTPLAIMKGEIEAALRTHKTSKDGSKTAPGEETTDSSDSLALRNTLQEVEHLSQIVQQLLLLARVEAGRGTIGFSPVALDEVILEAISRIQKTAEKKNIRIQFNIENSDTSESRPEVLGDFDLLQNLVFNLIENAVKYSPPDEMVKVSLQWLEKSQIVWVEDHGPGVPEVQIDMIFERFHRADSSHEGYGLGLAIAKKIAAIHGAVLKARSNQWNPLKKAKKAGCCFTLEIKNI